MNHYEIYTDGSFKGKWGAWAYLIMQNGQILTEKSGRSQKTNSNRMEFQAVIEALQDTLPQSRITLFTDFKILIEKIACFEEWGSQNWVKKQSQPIPNVDQLKILQGLLNERVVKIEWVKAHSGNPYNERCDELCKLARTPLKF